MSFFTHTELDGLILSRYLSYVLSVNKILWNSSRPSSQLQIEPLPSSKFTGVQRLLTLNLTLTLTVSSKSKIYYKTEKVKRRYLQPYNSGNC